MGSVFCTSGPVPPHSPAYVERAADRKARQCLLAMDCLWLAEPPGTGKTSLLHRLRAKAIPEGYTLAYVDLEGLDRGSEAKWYGDLCSRLVPQLGGAVEGLPEVGDRSGFDNFLRCLAERAAESSRRIAIALDALESVPRDFAAGFFGALREALDARRSEPCFRGLTFVLAGAFDPRALIEDPRLSPFPLARRVVLRDFYRPQVRQLVDLLGVTGDAAAAIADRIYRWTSGQPYLTQRVCALLAEGDLPLTSEGVDRAAERVWREGDEHLSHIFKELEEAPRAREYLERIMAGQPLRFAPSTNRLQARLALLGVIKADGRGRCIVRNRIYQEALRGCS